MGTGPHFWTRVFFRKFWSGFIDSVPILLLGEQANLSRLLVIGNLTITADEVMEITFYITASQSVMGFITGLIKTANNITLIRLDAKECIRRLSLTQIRLIA